MKIQTEPYLYSITQLPATGQHIIGHQTEDSIVVYQAYNKQIADFAVKNQYLGGTHFSYNRMSWIKPNFLWMMYRCGWAEKENQERVLAIWISKAFFNSILQEAVHSSFDPEIYSSYETWKSELENKEVRLQWDPDHDPYGAKLGRRAIQLGLKDTVLNKFGKEEVQLIEDITEFVTEQRKHVYTKNPDNLFVPIERIYKPLNEIIHVLTQV